MAEKSSIAYAAGCQQSSTVEHTYDQVNEYHSFDEMEISDDGLS